MISKMFMLAMVAYCTAKMEKAEEKKETYNMIGWSYTGILTMILLTSI